MSPADALLIVRTAMRTMPNVSLVAEGTSQTPYLVLGDSRFRLPPQDFTALGFRGDRVRVVEPGTLAAFIDKPIRAAPSVRPSEVFFDCPARPSNFLRQWFVNCQDSRSLVQWEILVAGWLYMVDPMRSPRSPYVNSAANGIEDIFYNVKLDPVFVHRMYGPGGSACALTGLPMRVTRRTRRHCRSRPDRRHQWTVGRPILTTPGSFLDPPRTSTVS
jgi:hypothetical protein